MIIVVMLEMERLVAAIGKPQRHRREHQDLVHERRTRRVSVQGFMLERAVQRHQVGTERDDPPAELVPRPDEQPEGDPGCREQRQGLPFRMGSGPVRECCAIYRRHFRPQSKAITATYLPDRLLTTVLLHQTVYSCARFGFLVTIVNWP